MALYDGVDDNTHEALGPAHPDARAEAEGVLRALAGETARLREDQWEAIAALVLDQRRALVVQRTGWGKSAVYFVATALLRQRGAGPTVIVSPLLALMRNQIAAAEAAGIRARTINSANIEEWSAIESEVRDGAVDVLLVSPERLNNPAFRDELLPKLADTTGLLVVDEAHCISDWGHDFRPDYRRIRTLLARLAVDTPVLATTATANARVTDDVAEQLGTDVLVQRGRLDRDSLRLSVVRLETGMHRLAWLVEHLSELTGSGIIYTLTVAQAGDIAALLKEHGYAVAPYSGRTDPADRLTAEDDLLAGRVKALVATSALGMGFDKPDLGFVVHVGAPQSPIAYYQQVGRAGRAVERADVILLPGPEDEAIWRYYASLGFPAEEQVRAVLEALAGTDKPQSTATLETRVDLARSRLETMLKVLDVDGAVQRVRGGWVATGDTWAYDGQRHARVRRAREHEQQLMRDYIATTSCRMEFLRRTLDDPGAGEPGATPCGRCDNCRGSAPPLDVSPTVLETVRAEAGRPGVALAPRAMWPSGLKTFGIAASGRIPARELPEEGRAIARLSDPGWGPRLRGMLAADTADGPLPDDVLDAVVEVLRSWDWERRPVAVAAIGSGHRPQLVGSLGQRLAATGRLRWLGELARTDAPERDDGRSNSAQRVRELHGTFTVPDAMREELAELHGAPVLLIDTLWDSGWTATLAARELRLAGAAEVLPFTLAAAG